MWNRNFIAVFIANGCMQVGVQMCNALLATYVNYLGAPLTVAGMTVGAFAYTALVFKVVSAPAIDTFNRRTILACAMAVLGSAFAIYGLFDNVLIIILGRLLQGVSAAFTITCALSMAADSLPPERMGTGIGYFSLTQAISLAIGPSIGIFIADAFGYPAVFVTCSVITFIGLVFVLAVKQDPPPKKKFKISLKSVFAKEAVVPAVLFGLMMICNTNIMSFMVPFAQSAGLGAYAGLFFLVFAVAMLFFRPAAGKAADRYGTAPVLVAAMALFILAFVFLSFADGPILLFASALAAALGYGTGWPVIQAFTLKCVPADRRGSATSTCYIGGDIGSIVGPVAAGAVAEGAGYQAMWAAQIVPLGLALLVLIFAFRYIGNLEGR